ncbi:hypothetical protein GE09DRAFT_1190155 [Coniochaeta sp. 2T2.1]|nr:hypothetical protein GE09DRAFT_1190155 [Coniochaeta sp. 2T2.1]
MNSAWNGQDHGMQPGQEDDFQQFLDMNGMSNMGDGMQFDFGPDFHNGNGANNHMLPNQHQHRQPLDTAMSGTDTPDMLARADPSGLHQMPTMSSAVSYQSIPATMIPPPTPTEAIVNTIDAQIQFLQQQKLQHQLHEQQLFVQQHQQRIVPPTPQSLELQAGAHHYYPNAGPSDQTPQQQPLDYRYQRLKDQQEMLFTPLVSPAVTPLETHFPIDAQFTVPGAYFSPLTSPALHAQNDNMASYEHSRHGSITTSPVKDTASSPLSGLMSGSSVEATKKTRKNAAKRGSKAGVRQSPITKPQRRGKTTTLTPLLNEQVLSELVEAAEEHQQQLPLPALPTSSSATPGTTDSEHNDSVSPEALHDSTLIDMPPPPLPKPRSAKPSPFLGAQNHPHHLPGHVMLPGGMPSPATPASLMKLSSPNTRTTGSRGGSQEPHAIDHIENFELPDSVHFPKQTTPTAGSRTPVLAPSGIARSGSAKASPFMKPMSTSSATPSPRILPNNKSSSSTSERKTPLLAARSNTTSSSKKRSSVSSVPISPALLPRISPNIKPLLPGSAEDAASHLLATKSNYQRILDGNTLPGVSYPTELSTNLTSKRTSHKIAEQGRRNRINSALLEMATLLPVVKKDAKEEAEEEREREKEKKEGKGGGVPNSKASTVELAIDYIRQLKREIEEANRRAEEAEERLKSVEAGGGGGGEG